MRITASYISSKFNPEETIKKLSESDNISAIHADLMDGIYVTNKNFEIKEVINLLKKVKKDIDIHLMVMDPEIYLDDLFTINSNTIFFHPNTTKDPIELISYIKNNKRSVGIVINPNEDIKDFINYFPYVDAVLVMSVTPGKGGQTFLRNSLVNYELVKKEREKYHFALFVDGGINNETINLVNQADAIIAGSYICNSDNFDEQAKVLIDSINKKI